MKIKHIVTAGILAGAIGTGLALTACGGSNPATVPAARTTAVAPTVVPSAAVPAAPVATAQSTCSQIAAWAATSGLANLTAIESDLSTAETDADAGNLTAVESDGYSLAADAGSALADPMPGNASYATAMTAIATAGNDMAAGDITGATAQMDSATPLLTAIAKSLPAAC